jgi:hypothetical protein
MQVPSPLHTQIVHPAGAQKQFIGCIDRMENALFQCKKTPPTGTFRARKKVFKPPGHIQWV